MIRSADRGRRLTAAAALPLLLVLLPVLAACASPAGELARVAKDWCLTVRASQVLPVYPLTEDLQPGDVFLVPTPLARQTEVYQQRGFLPLDQLVQRLGPLPYAEFYGDGYWQGRYGGAPHPRPGWSAVDDAAVAAPRVAFPTHGFVVDGEHGLQLALPIQAVPVALGVLGASQARGSVMIREAYTYGVDGETLYRRLYEWWQSEPQRAQTLAAMTQGGAVEVYLRVVTRVFLTGGVTVQVTDAGAAGAAAAAGPALELLELAIEQPDRAAAAAAAWREALAALAGSGGALAEAGGALRFRQASRRSVTLDEDFDRPLALGYLGFDVKVFADGRLSVPIPSYATLVDQSDALRTAAKVELSFDAEDELGARLRRAMRDATLRAQILAWVEQQQGAAVAASDLISARRYRALRERVIAEFDL